MHLSFIFDYLYQLRRAQINLLSYVCLCMYLQLSLVPPASRPFESIIKCNIGNPQALKQKPLSFIRDVLSIMVNPSLVSSEQLEMFVVEGVCVHVCVCMCACMSVCVSDYTCMSCLIVMRVYVSPTWSWHLLSCFVLCYLADSLTRWLAYCLTHSLTHWLSDASLWICTRRGG